MPCFLMYSNRLGWAGSILASLIGTAIIVLIIWAIKPIKNRLSQDVFGRPPFSDPRQCEKTRKPSRPG